MPDNIELLNEQVSVVLPRGAWNAIIGIIWKSATCEVGNPLLEAIRGQLQRHEQMQQQTALPSNGSRES